MAEQATTTGTALVPTEADMRALGRRLATALRAGDLVLLHGELGAGKTTLVRGLGEGLRVRGAVTSPTFVIARAHPSEVDGPSLVHVDAYRLDSLEEVDDLDLDASVDESVTVVEWGEGKAETLSPDRLDVRIERATGDQPLAADDLGDPAALAGDTRRVTVTGVGERWAAVDPRTLLELS